ncbi:MAG: hypothetical protein GY821_12850 [Gammaproteobacteria bacterium]|nr:hypothetical protein [Gammaproteobacteria bacterium]
MFDIIKYYEDFNIDYKTEGNNVSEGWVNINCPFCSDISEHLGFNLKNGKISCWRCGPSNLRSVIEETSYLTSIPVDVLIKKYQIKNSHEINLSLRKNEERKQDVEIKLNTHATAAFHQIDFSLNPMRFPHNMDWWKNSAFVNYLEKRKFDWEQIQKDWNIWIGGFIGKFKWRIIMPVYFNNKLVSYVGRDITNKQKPKYLNLGGTNIKNYLYGYDFCKEKESVIVVEGILDAWRLGKGNAVATFGTQITAKQLLLLKQFKKVGVLFDCEKEAMNKAKQIVETLKALGVDAILIQLPPDVKDPAELSIDQANKIVVRFN